MSVIEATSVRKTFGQVVAVDGVSFDVDAGGLVALIGPNGAGKTTLIEMLEGYTRPDHGHVRVFATDPWRAGQRLRERVGVVLQSCGFDPYLTVEEAVRQRARWYPSPQPVLDVLTATGLADLARRRAQLLSGGEQRRLDLALALVGNPDLLFLDEPTTGLDAAARRGVWATVRQLLNNGMTILLTTHYLEEAAALAERIMVLARGRIVADGSPDDLVRAHGGRTTVSFWLPSGALAEASFAVPSTRLADGHCVVTAPAGGLTATLHTLASWAVEQRLELHDLQVNRPTLESIYLALTEQATECDNCA